MGHAATLSYLQATTAPECVFIVAGDFSHSNLKITSTGVWALKQGKINPWIRCIEKLLDSRTTCICFWPLISRMKPHETVQTQEVSGLWSSLNTKTLSNALQQYCLTSTSTPLPKSKRPPTTRDPGSTTRCCSEPGIQRWDRETGRSNDTTIAGLMTDNNSPLHTALLEVALFQILLPIFCLQGS